ncbi:MAG: hypothetical protein ACLQNE_30480 [Thermoguttaceae bacterium]
MTHEGLFLLGVAVCLLASGCNDSKKPLSDRQTSKADERLLGVWRERSDDQATYYHVGQNVARFVTEAGDSLWNTSMWPRGSGRFERVNVGKKP